MRVRFMRKFVFWRITRVVDANSRYVPVENTVLRPVEEGGDIKAVIAGGDGGFLIQARDGSIMPQDAYEKAVGLKFDVDGSVPVNPELEQWARITQEDMNMTLDDDLPDVRDRKVEELINRFDFDDGKAEAFVEDLYNGKAVMY